MSDANPKRGWGNPLVRRLLAVAASLALVLSLGACVGRNGVKPFPITPEIASAMPCEPTVGPSPLQVSNTIAALAEAKAPGRRAGLEDWGLNPDLKDPAAVKAIDEVRSALRKRVDECQKANRVRAQHPRRRRRPVRRRRLRPRRAHRPPQLRRPRRPAARLSSYKSSIRTGSTGLYRVGSKGRPRRSASNFWPRSGTTTATLLSLASSCSTPASRNQSWSRMTA